MKKDRIAVLDKIIEWALYILVFSIPFSKTAVEGSILVAFIAWAVKKILIKDFRFKQTPLNGLLFAFAAVNFISVVNSGLTPLFARSIITKCIKYIVLYFIVVETVDSEKILKKLLIMASLSAVIVMADSFLQYYVLHMDLIRLYPSFKYAPLTDASLRLGFPTGPFPFPNDLAAWMLIILMPAATVFIRGRKSLTTKISLGAFLFPGLFLFYLTNVRSAWLGFFTSLFLVLFILARKIFMAFIIFILAGAIILLLLPGEKTADIFGLSSLQDRLYMWRIGWKIFQEHPIIGNGLNTGFLKFQEYREDAWKGQKGSYFHNGFLQIAAETGIIGLLVFLLIIGKALTFTLRRPAARVLNLGLAGGLLAFLIHSFFDTNLQSLPLVVLFWFNLGLLTVAQNIYARKI